MARIERRGVCEEIYRPRRFTATESGRSRHSPWTAHRWGAQITVTVTDWAPAGVSVLPRPGSADRKTKYHRATYDAKEG